MGYYELGDISNSKIGTPTPAEGTFTNIDDSPIGQNTPAAGAFTTLKAGTDPVDADGVGDRLYNDTRYSLNSLFDANSILKADSDDTPIVLTVAEQTMIGRITAGVITTLTPTQIRTLLNVSDGADVTANNAPQAHRDNHNPESGSDSLDTAAPLELASTQASGVGTAYSLARSDHAHQIQHSITDNHIVTIDHADAADDDYAKFTANGLEGRSYSEVKSDLGYMTDLVEDTTPQLGGDLDGQGNYLVGVQNIPDLSSKGSGYYFNGTDSHIILTSTELNPKTGNYSILASINNIGRDSLDNIIFMAFEGGAVDDACFFYIDSSGYLEASLEESDVVKIVKANKTDIGADGKHHIVGYTIDRESTTGLKLYVDGKEETYSLQEDPTSLTGDINPGGNKTIGAWYSGTANFFIGEIPFVYIFNLELTADEVKSFSSNAPIPYKYLGANQTVLTSGTLIVGKQYKIDTFVTGDDFTNIGGTNVTGNEFIATGTTPTTWTNGSSLKQIGCILQLEQNGIGHSQWLDSSGNELHGTVSEALPINLSTNNIERFRHTVAITDDTTWTDVVPAGYMLESIAFVESAGNAAILDLGTTATGQDVFEQQTIAASSITTITINKIFSMSATQSLYLNDDGTGTWNGASITATLFMKRVI